MWRNKKAILMAVLATVVLAGIIGGVALAQTQNGDDTQPVDSRGALLDRVCEIYEQNTGTAINPGDLNEAFAQAQRDMRTEALQNRLQNLVDQGKITQGEAEQYLEWWQSRPDVPMPGPFGKGFGGHGPRGGMCGMWNAR